MKVTEPKFEIVRVVVDIELVFESFQPLLFIAHFTTFFGGVPWIALKVSMCTKFSQNAYPKVHVLRQKELCEFQ